MPIALILTLLLGGSFSYAAEGALPGETLYPVKVSVNEKVRTALTFSAEAKANLEARLAARRLEEAADLASQGRLTTITRTEIESRFEKHVSLANGNMARLEGNNKSEVAADISSRFESSLLAHEQILIRLASSGADETDINATRDTLHIRAAAGATTSTQSIDHEEQNEIPTSENIGISAKIGTEMQPILSRVRKQIKSITSKRVEFEARVRANSDSRVKRAAEEKRESAKNKIEETRRFIRRAGASADMQARAEARLDQAETVHADGETHLQAEAFGDAFSLFQKAHRIAQEAKLLLEARERLKIDFGVGATNNDTKEEKTKSQQFDSDNDSKLNTSGEEKDENEMEENDRKDHENANSSDRNEKSVHIENGIRNDNAVKTEANPENSETQIESETEIKLRLEL